MEQTRKGTEKDEEEGSSWKNGRKDQQITLNRACTSQEEKKQISPQH